MNHKVQMLYHHEDVKEFNLNTDYKLRYFQKGDQNKWANVVYLSGEFETIDSALIRFDQEFSKYETDLTSRCLFLENKDNEVIGTIMVWFGKEDTTRIHWLSIIPEYQGLGLSKVLLSEALKIAPKNKSIYLTTQSKSLIAIKLYQSFNFKPIIKNKQDEIIWHEINNNLQNI